MIDDEFDDDDLLPGMTTEEYIMRVRAFIACLKLAPDIDIDGGDPEPLI